MAENMPQPTTSKHEQIVWIVANVRTENWNLAEIITTKSNPIAAPSKNLIIILATVKSCQGFGDSM